MAEGSNDEHHAPQVPIVAVGWTLAAVESVVEPAVPLPLGLLRLQVIVPMVHLPFREDEREHEMR
jgi:hypothetical protein